MWCASCEPALHPIHSTKLLACSGIISTNGYVQLLLKIVTWIVYVLGKRMVMVPLRFLLLYGDKEMELPSMHTFILSGPLS